MFVFTFLSRFLGWEKLWQDNFVPWHESIVNPKLVKYLDVAMQASGKKDPSVTRFFVPLCGKTQDLKYLYDKGFQVIGCEGVEKACIEFFEDNKMEFIRKELENGMILFQVISVISNLSCH